MPIPSRFDHELADIENAASGILTQLRTMQHASARDVPAMRGRLRDMLRAYVDLVMATAPDGR
jgi:hypothetical protein